MIQGIAASKFERWRTNPVAFVREVFGAEPDPIQEQVLRSFTTSPRIAMKASKGTGKLHPKSMIFDTPDGVQTWGMIKKGSRVFAPDGFPTEVLETYENGVVDLYRVSFDDGSFTVCGLEHLWKVKGIDERRKNLDWSVLTTKQIIERGVRVKNGKWQGRQFEIPLHEPVQYTERNLPIDPYIIGVWLGDGTRGRGNYTGIDQEVQNEIVSRGYELGVEQYQTRTILGVQSKLRDLGILYQGSYERCVPELYLNTSVQQRKDVLSGLLDTDGTIDKNGAIQFDTTSRDLAQNVTWLVRSLGGNAVLRPKVKKSYYYDENNDKIFGRDCYSVSIKLLFNPFKVQRKANRWKEPKNNSQLRYLKRYIDSIDFVGREDSMCIEVAHPSKCYLANDFIVTHNTCCLAWLTWNFLLTRPHPIVVATSISSDNLSDGLWTEMARWRNKSPLIREMFEWTKTRIFSKENSETWFMSARPWSKSADKQQQANTLAGIHADYVMFVIDESGGIPDAVMSSAEAILTSSNSAGKEAHLIQAGNPTHLEGPLYRACTTEKNLWKVFEMTGDPDNPGRSPRVSIEWAREQIAKYGKDNPWVLVNVFGKFPPSSFNALIGPEELSASIKRRYKEQEFSGHPVILGVDVARYGDDSSIIFPRQGLQAFTPFQFRDLDGTQGADILIRKWNELNVDGVFIDNTGGFGASWIDNAIRLGKSPIGIHFSQTPSDSQYFNKRAEMIFNCVDWIKRGGAIPDIPELVNALTATTYSFKGNQLIVEPKEDIKAKLGGTSPDHMDALCLTFAMPVEKQLRDPVYAFASRPAHQFEYDPLARGYLH